MMRSLYSGVAGLKAHQTGMDVVGNNIANVNTTGFKSFRATYQDTLYQTSSGAAAPQDNKGGVNPIQVGLGVGNASIDKMFKDGSVQATSSKTDLCLSGDGLFIVQDGSGEYYTRNGAFKFDAKGNYVNSAGQYVMGWMGVDGEVNTNPKPGLICIPSGKPMEPKTTTIVTYANNLNAADPTIVKMSDQDGNPITGTATVGKDGVTSLKVEMSDGTIQVLKSGTYTTGHSLPLTTTLTVYDSKGNAHTLAVTLEKTGTDTNCWEANLVGTTVLAVVPANADASKKTFVFTNGDTLVRDVGDKYLFNVAASSQDTLLYMDSAGNVESGKVSAGANQISITVPGTLALPISDAANDTYIYEDNTNPGTYRYAKVSAGATTPVVPPGYTQIAKVDASASKDSYVFNDGSVVNVTKGSTYKTTVAASANDTAVFKTGSTTIDTAALSAANATMAREVAADAKQDTVVLSDGKDVKQNAGSAAPAANDTVIVEEDGSITTVAMDTFKTQFKTDGSYDTDNSQIGTITLTPRNGAAEQTVTVDTSGLTQYAGSNTVNGDWDGNAAGTLVEVNIDSSGTITGTYSNGINQKEAVVAVAQFNNAGGLTAKGASLFQKSNNSGKPNVKTASDLGCTITGSALEMSNVDLANEFSTMIVTQRGYQSNSKVITVSDEMLETLIQMKR